MGAMVSPNTSRTELNSVQTRMAKVRTGQNSPTDIDAVEDDLDLLSLIETARQRARLKLEYLAEKCSELGTKVSKGQLSGALSGNGGFNVRWLERWPIEFWAEFLPLVRAVREQSPNAVRLMKIERLKTAINELIDLAEVMGS